MTVYCRCGAKATSTVTVKDQGRKVTTGTCDQCWQQTYDAVKGIEPRSWIMLVQVEDLLDFLPKEEEPS